MADGSALPPVSPTLGIPAMTAVYYPNAWPDDPAHWLNSDEYAWFKQAWDYASTQTNAIPALSKVSPTEMFWAFYCIDRGRAALRAGPPGEPSAEAVRGRLENIYHGWLDIAAERMRAGKPAPSATEAANAFAAYAAPLFRGTATP